ncbi:WD40 repeat domain-containing protein [Halosolutus halophilus]|uniref:WD40 repeat domain-containing protein n=1 Tax=Halosolutus halophilus TaxID=1552990 RepID=UPI002234FEE2|nr:PQQ-binding-like beta-propeller repeat protein [Halosolutus halophilus]
MIPNVGSDLPSSRVFDGVEFFTLLDEIHSKSDSVVANYSETFVSDLYAELDAGNITPTQVRSPEGMARFLSGTDDPTNARFRIAMLQQFGMEQPDFSLVSGMTVSWTGATDQWVDPNPNLDARHVYPDGYVSGKSYSGVLFGSDVPDGGFQSGETYGVGLPLYYAGSNDLAVQDAVSGEVYWQRSMPNRTNALTAVLSENRVYAATHSTDSTLYGYDTTTGEQVLEYQGHGDAVYALDRSADGLTIYTASYDGEVHAVDTETGNADWTYTSGPSGGGAVGVAADESGSAVFTIYSDGVDFDSQIHAIDPSDGSQMDTYADANWNLETVACTGDGTVAYVGGRNNLVMALPFDGATIASPDWTYSTPDRVFALALSPDETVLYAAVSLSSSGEIHAIDVADGTNIWTYSGFTDGLEDVVVSPDGGRVYAGNPSAGELHVVDAQDGSAVRTGTPMGSIYSLALPPTDGSIDGLAAASLLYDESNNREVRFSHGTIDVNEMYDAGGATITHVTDETITDIESVVGKGIESIVDEMSQFDSVSDIKYTKHVLDILDFYGINATVGESDSDDITVTEPDYDTPKYDTYDSTQFADYINTLETYIEQLEAEETTDESGWGFAPFGDWSSGELLGLGIIGLVIMWMVGVATDLIPGVGN